LLEAISAFTVGVANDLFPVELASPINDSFLYMAFLGALPTPQGGNGVFDTYKATRTSGAWETTDLLSHPPTEVVWPLPGGVSADHEYSFQRNANTTYLRKPDGSFELAGIGSLGNEASAQGRYISEGGEHVIFSTGHGEEQSAWCFECPVSQLEAKAAPAGTGAIYDRSPTGPTRVVSLLPGNVPPSAGEDSLYKGASRDGKFVAFTINEVLYVRVKNQDTEEVAAGGPTFAGLSDDGRYLFYVAGDTIHRFDTTNEADVEVNPTGKGEVVNVSADGSHVYFISEQQLDGSNGTGGQPNMYVWSGGALKYIATVAPSDLTVTSGLEPEFPALTNWTDWVFNRTGVEPGPGAESSRTTPDGAVLIFESRAQLTSYSNEGHTEIYRYDDIDSSLLCASCNPSGSPAKTDAKLQNLSIVPSPIVIHNVSDDGHRVFFETDEPLVDGDTNGVNDIYEWQEKENSAEVQLISTGTSPEYPLPPGSEEFLVVPRANVLLSITPDGNDVFFMAEQPLVVGAGEAGAEGIYDARVNGGFPTRVSPTGCLEEGCRSAAGGAGVSFGPARSETLRGRGNVKPGKKPCRRHRELSDRHNKHRRCGKRRAAQSALVRRGTVPKTQTSFQAGDESSSLSQAPSSVPAQVTATPLTPLGLEVEGFGIRRFESEESTTIAARHPDFTTTIEFKDVIDKAGNVNPAATTAEISVSLPPGLLGNPEAMPRCDTGAFVADGACPVDSQVGITRVRLGPPVPVTTLEPVFSLVPPHPDSEIARFGFMAASYPVYLDVAIRTASDYGVTVTAHEPPGLGTIINAKTTVWGNPADSSHDEQRLTAEEARHCTSIATCKPAGGQRKSGIPPADRRAFLTNPSGCQDNEVELKARAYQLPGQVFIAHAPLIGADTQVSSTTDCTDLSFAPSFETETTSQVAGAPTGIRTKLVIPQHLGPEEGGTATMREARVTLPKGLQVAAGAANWIGTCSEEQVAYHEEVGATCPDSSKLGTATFVSPALPEPIQGTIYQREPRPGHQLGLWLTSDSLGLHIKLPGELEPDPDTGRLTAVFRDLPQVPVEEIDLNVWGGSRAPLQNPDHCGTFATDYAFSPHSNDPAVSGQSQIQISEGCNQGFSPSLHGGVTEPTAGAFSPLVVDLHHEDGQQAVRGFKLHLPDGELAKLAGVPLCLDPAAAAGSCPAGSRIGSLSAVTGPGPEPLQVPQPGKAQPAIYLAGPYQGAPYSIVSEVPAQAGPFDLGVLAVRSGLEIDPETARATVNADPLPQFFEGVGIAYRHLHAVIDRPNFSLNPTDCRETQITSDITSTQGTVAHPAARFEVDGCKALKFRPSLSLTESGGPKEMRRTGNPQLTAVLRARRGDANIAATTVLLPHSQFIDQSHISNPCTRVQYNENGGAGGGCPKRSVLGTVEATTSLLDQPLKGKVYFRSNGGDRELPDVVLSLNGPIHIEQVGFVDSRHGRIRTRFASIPDAPLSKVTIRFFGGKRSLLENSTNLCSRIQKARVTLAAQNGRGRTANATITTSCGNHSGSG